MVLSVLIISFITKVGNKRSSLSPSLSASSTLLLFDRPNADRDGVCVCRWDEWVPEERLNKYNEENIRKQKALIEQQRARDAAEREAQKALEAENARKSAAAAAAGTSLNAGNSAGVGASLAGMTGGAGVPGNGMAAVRARDDKRNVKRGREGEGVSSLFISIFLRMNLLDSILTSFCSNLNLH